MKNSIRKLFLIVPLALLFVSTTTFASDESQIVSVRTNEDSISVYVRGANEADNSSCIIGNREATVDEVKNISELPESIETLVLIDNSASITKEERKKTAEILRKLVSEMIPGESISIGTFTDSIVYLCDYSNNVDELNSVIDSIVYQDQDAFLSDVLYNLISGNYSKDDVFRRIIVVSDGADTSPKNVSQSEMNNLLENSTIPIYSFGCTSKNNGDILQNMFSFSRMTKGEAFLLSDYSETDSIIIALTEDKSIIKYTITPSAESMDGSIKAVRLSIGDKVLNVECKMPQVVMEEPVVEEPHVEEPVVEEEPVSEESEPIAVPIPVSEKKSSFNVLFVIVPVFLVVGIVSFIIILSKKKKESRTGTAYSGARTNISENTVALRDNSFDSEKTVMLTDEEKTVMLCDDDKTQLLGNEGFANCTIVLTDVQNPSKQIMHSMYDTVIIGRKVQEADIAIDYERTISGKHCVIMRKYNQFTIRDLGSSNGTFVNGTRIWDEVSIQPGDRITLGRLELLFEVM